jgi:hypothetical protein
MTQCEACGSEKIFGTPADGVRYACGAYRIGSSALVRSRGCLDNEVRELREFKRRVMLANRKLTYQDVATAIKELCR